VNREKTKVQLAAEQEVDYLLYQLCQSQVRGNDSKMKDD
jgi:hypothetical protein